MLSPAVTVALPGTGSDAVFARHAFDPAAAEARVPLVAVDPDPRGVVAGYRAALDNAAETGPVLVTGISIGAVVGLVWAAEHPESTAAVIAALPPWIGEPGDAPAAQAATHTASRLRAAGLADVIAEMRASSPPWLADALTRSWRAQWPYLPAALDEAAHHRAPTEAELAEFRVPVAVVGATDDPVHPFGTACRWAELLPDAALATVTLHEIGADPGVLGRRGIAALPTTTTTTATA